MERTPEPELMNEAEQARAYAEADFSEPHNACIDQFRRCFPDFTGGRVLDLGCGPADISCRFAQAYPEATVIGVDAAPAMLQLGEQRIQQLGLQARVQLHRAYLPDDAIPHTGEYSAVISNSLLHHLKDPMALWSSIKQQHSNRLTVFIMDLMRPESPAQLNELMGYVSEEPEILQHDFFHSLQAAYRPDEIQQQLAKAGLALDIDIISDRHFIVFGHLADV